MFITEADSYYIFYMTGVARAISIAAGQGFDEMCEDHAKNHPLSTGDVSLTTAGNLPCQMVRTFGPVSQGLFMIKLTPNLGFSLAFFLI